MTGYAKVPIFILLNWCIVLTTPASVRESAAAGGRSDRIVSLDSRFCYQSLSQLFCDFNWTPGAVSLTSQIQSESLLKSIHIQKVHELLLDYSTVNSDLSLAHITTVKVQKHLCQSPHWKLSLRNTTIEVLTEPVSSIYADESHVKNLTLNSLSGHVTVIGSKVDTCRISEVTTETEVSLKIHSTTIKNFEQLKLTKSGMLLMHSSTIEYFSPEALVLDGSQRNLISGVKFPVLSGDTSANIILSNGADITLEDNSGTVKIASPPCPVVYTSNTLDDGEQEIPRVTIPRSENVPIDEVYMCKSLVQNNTTLSIALILSLIVNLLFILSRNKTRAIIGKIVKAILKQKPEKVSGVSDPLLSTESASWKMDNIQLVVNGGNTEKFSDSSKSLAYREFHEKPSKHGSNLTTNYKPSARKRRVTFSGPYNSSSESISDN